MSYPLGLGKTHYPQMSGRGLRHSTGRAVDIKVNINAEMLNKMLERIRLKYLGVKMNKFNVGQAVFSTVYGYGEVLHTSPETDDDSYPVQVVFKKGLPGEVVEFYDHSGENAMSGRITLFCNKAEAIKHIERVEREYHHERVFNFYDDGKHTSHIDEISAIAGTTYEEAHNARKLVKRHRVTWTNVNS